MKIINISELETNILPSIEIISGTSNLYHFSSYFKLNECIVAHVIKKYQEQSNYFKKKEFKKDKHLLVGNDIERKLNILTQAKYKEILDLHDLKREKPVAFYKKRNSEFIVTQSRILGFPTEGEWIGLKDITFVEEKKETYSMQAYHNGYSVVIKKMPLKLVKLIQELKILNKQVPIRCNRHPYYRLSFEERMQYVKVLAYTCCSQGYLIANQIGRLEQIARQLNVDSKYVIEFVTEALAIEEKKYKEKLHSNVGQIEAKYCKILLIDLLTLEFIGEKMGAQRGMMDKELKQLLKVSFSEIMQVKEQVHNKLNQCY